MWVEIFHKIMVEERSEFSFSAHLRNAQSRDLLELLGVN